MINFNTIMGWIVRMVRAMRRALWAQAEAPPPAAAPPPTQAAVGFPVLASSGPRYWPAPAAPRVPLWPAPAPRAPLWPAPGPIWYNASSQALLPGYWDNEE